MSEIKELIEVNKEILKWIKIANLDKVKPILESTLKKDEQKQAYDLSDGFKTRDIIADEVDVSNATVSNWWNSWAKFGIIEQIPVMGGGNRGKKVFELADYDIKVPKKLSKKSDQEKLQE